MSKISQIPLPETALLARYAGLPGHHTDCFTTYVDAQVQLADYIEAFFDSPVLKLERRLLALASMPSSQEQVQSLSNGTGEQIAGWRLEARNDNQLLLAVFQNGIRTWLMVAPEKTGTRLYFGSAVVPKDPAQPKSPVWVRALMGFHYLYSRIVLGAAKWQLRRQSRQALA